MSYILKVKRISIVNESGDRVAVFNCYLVDSSNVAFKSLDGGEIGFDIRVPKSSVPGSSLPAYLQGLAQDQIAKKYNRYLTATYAPTHNTDRLLFNASDVEKLFIGLTVTGAGITSAVTLKSVTSPTEIQLTSNLTLQVTGSTVSPYLVYTGTTTVDTNVITLMSGITDVTTGMVISGTGIPYGSTVLSIISSSSISITQKATASGATALTFSTNPNSAYLNISLPASYFTTDYEGLTISGTSIVRNTTIAEMITATKIRLSNNATGTTSGQTYVISGKPTYYFNTASLTVNYDELRNQNIVNFAAL